jgi:D-amino peptidase
MKVYISVDMEGVACVTHPNHTKLEGAEYERARKWMTAEANAAVEGALEAGATEVVVADSHGHMFNMLPDELHEDALLVRGTPRPLTMMEGLDETFDAAFFVGYHSQAGTPEGILAHTYMGRSVYGIRLNGVAVGEPGFNAAIAGHFGVPVALACGDDTVDAEVGALLPWTERVVTKWVLSPIAARNLTPRASQNRIHKGARRALGRLSEMTPWTLETPIRFEVDFMLPIQAYLAADIPGVERVAGRTLVYTGADMLAVTCIWRLMLNASRGDAFV